MKILVLGATGLLGNATFRVLSEAESLEVYGTARSTTAEMHFSPALAARLITIDDLEDATKLVKLLDVLGPDTVLNCIALPRVQAQDTARLIAVYSLLPRRLHYLCRERDIRLIQIGSDAVFSGKRGGYSEDDLPDAVDSYGIAKMLGEVDGPLALTLRTSMIGPELVARNGLLSWFLAQEDKCRCYTRAIFSGLPTTVLAQILRDFILPDESLHGVYHVAAEPISKFDLLALVRQRYGKQIQMIPDDSVVIDRSLSAERFRRATGYIPPPWEEMLATMHAFNFGLRKS
jgi:dTDP-4-dehydrorhamnose reductase